MCRLGRNASKLMMTETQQDIFKFMARVDGSPGSFEEHDGTGAPEAT